jgi:hypothetical protein
MLGCNICLAVLCAVATTGVCSELQKFYIGGLFPYDSKDPHVRDGLGTYPMLAAQLAQKHITEKGILSALNVSLELKAFGTNCEKDSAVYAYLQLVEDLKERTAGEDLSLYSHVKF